MGKKMCEIKPGEPKYLEAVEIPQYYCSKCGRIARDEKYLCKPRKLPNHPAVSSTPIQEKE